MMWTSLNLKKAWMMWSSACVNQVGVEVNSASKQLLMYVSGLGPALAAAIVEYRNAHGVFDSREGLKKVPKLGSQGF